MEFEWDEAKDRENRRKHGLGLGEAAGLDWENALRFADARRDDGEHRMTAFALLSGRVAVCIYTIRKNVFRVISLRKANPREVSIYEQAQQRR